MIGYKEKKGETMDRLYDLFGPTAVHVAEILLRVLISLIVLLIVLWVAGRLFRRTERKLLACGRDVTYLRYLRYVVRVLLSVMILAGALRDVPGMNTLFASLLAGSGIVAVTVGLASQQAIGNLVSGVMLLLFRPFKVGDTIRYLSNDITGVIEEIGLRHTTIRTLENKRLFVPNNLMNSNVVENFSAENPAVTFCLEVDIPYEVDTARAMELMSRAIAAHPDFTDRRSEEAKAENKPAVPVRIQALGGNAVKLHTWIWAKNSTAAIQLKSDLLLAVKNSFQEADIGIK